MSSALDNAVGAMQSYLSSAANQWRNYILVAVTPLVDAFDQFQALLGPGSFYGDLYTVLECERSDELSQGDGFPPVSQRTEAETDMAFDRLV